MQEPPLILICDDEVHILHVVGLKLRDAGYRVLTARDGSQGLSLAQQHHPALVITDYLMPTMNGIEFCRELRGDPQTKTIELIMLTARGANLPGDSLDGLGLAAIYTKPFSPRELLAEVQQLVPIKTQLSAGGGD